MSDRALRAALREEGSYFRDMAAIDPDPGRKRLWKRLARQVDAYLDTDGGHAQDTLPLPLPSGEGTAL